MVTDPEFVCVTVIENAPSEADAWPSLTVITIPEYVPALAADGVPASMPVDVLNVVNHVGRF